MRVNSHDNPWWDDWWDVRAGASKSMTAGRSGDAGGIRMTRPTRSGLTDPPISDNLRTDHPPNLGRHLRLDVIALYLL